MSDFIEQSKDFPFGSWTVYSLDDGRFDDFINRQYGFNAEKSPTPKGAFSHSWGFRFAADEDHTHHGSVHVFNIEPVDYHDDVLEELAEFLTSNGEKGTNHTHNILTDLCTRGIIPAGDYQIHVS